MQWTEKRAFIACTILLGFAIASGTSSIALMVIDTKTTDAIALVLSLLSAAMYIFVVVNARIVKKKAKRD